MSKAKKNIVIFIQAKGKIGAFKSAFPGAIVIATLGHIHQLPKKNIGINFKKDFEATFEVIPEKTGIVSDIKKNSKWADEIVIFTDKDNQGQAIANDIMSHVDDPSKVIRATSNVISDKALRESYDDAVKTNKKVDVRKYEEFLVRRLQDRIVGFKASFPVQQATGGPSVGRCQSPALRIVAEREKEIQSFIPVKYYNISAKLKTKSGEIFEVDIKTPKPLDISKEEDAKDIVDYLKNNKIIVTKYDTTVRESKPVQPYRTTTLQKEASNLLGMSPDRTMSICQKLYGESHVQSYHRTDSVFIVADVVDLIRDHIKNKYGAQYLPSKANSYVSKVSQAEAHEAIRPNDISLASFGSGDEHRMYELVWKKTIASQMMPQKYESLSVEISGKDKKFVFSTSGRKILFDGFKKVWDYGDNDDVILPDMKLNDELTLVSANYKEAETKPPARYSLASLVGQLQVYGIGRPSTMSSIVKTIQDRQYVKLNGKSLQATPLGMKVIDFMVNDVKFCFSEFEFTKNMEEQLDLIAEGKTTKLKVLTEFWQQLQKDLVRAKTAKTDNEETDHDCPLCKKSGKDSKLKLKVSRFGKFYACSLGKKECGYIAGVNKETGQPEERVKKEIVYSEHVCPKCGQKMVERTNKKDGTKFFGCSTWSKTKCGGLLKADGSVPEVKPKTGFKKKWFPKKKK